MAHVSVVGLQTDHVVTMACQDNLAFMRPLKSQSMQLVVTSPPYNIGNTLLLNPARMGSSGDVGPAYHFHVWDMAKTPPVLHELTAAKVKPHIPTDNEKGKWQSAVIPLGTVAASAA